jgi:hypothetical protein
MSWRPTCTCGHNLIDHADFIDATLDGEGEIVPEGARWCAEGQCLKGWGRESPCPCIKFQHDGEGEVSSDPMTMLYWGKVLTPLP